MNSNNQQSAHETGFSRPWAYLLRGWIMLLLGATLMLLTALKPHVKFFSVDFSWLPVAGFLLMLVGVPRCLDGIRSAKSPGFFYNFQGGILDTVVGFLVFSSIGKDPAFLVLLISGYLMTQGLFRFILSYLVPLKNPRSTRIGGVVEFDSWHSGMDAMAFYGNLVSIAFAKHRNYHTGVCTDTIC